MSFLKKYCRFFLTLSGIIVLRTMTPTTTILLPPHSIQQRSLFWNEASLDRKIMQSNITRDYLYSFSELSLSKLLAFSQRLEHIQQNTKNLPVRRHLINLRIDLFFFNFPSSNNSKATNFFLKFQNTHTFYESLSLVFQP